jgi:hypothetical protein
VTFRPDPDVVARRVDDEVVLVHLTRNEIYALNRTGARFWELLADGRTQSEAIAQLRQEFDVGEHQAEAEVAQLLGALEQQGLIERVDL